MNRLVSFAAQNFLELEFIIPLLVSIELLILQTRWGFIDVVLQELTVDRQEVYGALAAVFGALLGFAITSISIIVGYIEDDRFALLRQSKHYQQLWQIFISAIRALSIATLTTLLGLVFDTSEAPNYLLIYLIVGTTLLAGSRVWRTLWVLEKIISVVSKPLLRQ